MNWHAALTDGSVLWDKDVELVGELFERDIQIFTLDHDEHRIQYFFKLGKMLIDGLGIEVPSQAKFIFFVRRRHHLMSNVGEQFSEQSDEMPVVGFESPGAKVLIGIRNGLHFVNK